MGRKSRIISSTNTYHVMMRGVNKQQIFHEPRDYERLISTLGRYKEISQFELYAYCLMGNHIHLLIRSDHEPIGQAIKRIGDSYVFWYNKKYNRCGHLFQDRFRSIPVEDDAYFLTVLRYIIQNPVVAGICKRVEDYAYSSALDYCTAKSGLTDTTIAKELLRSQNLRKYFNHIEAVDVVDMDERHTISDSEAKTIISIGKKHYHPGNKKELSVFVHNMHDCGISIRQLARLADIPKITIERILNLPASAATQTL